MLSYRIFNNFLKFFLQRPDNLVILLVMQISYLLKHILFWSLLSLALSLGAQVNAPNYPEEGLLREDQKGFLDPGVDYQKLVARVTDRDKSGHTFKLKSENKNSKFLRSGDRLAFTIGDKGRITSYNVCYTKLLRMIASFSFFKMLYFNRNPIGA